MKTILFVMTMLLLCSTALTICAVVEQDMTTALAALYLCVASAVGAYFSAGILDDEKSINK
jgi:heme/copper-type cytochrome/quinol oxidase subunit 3